jgi:hypothetical protein
MKKLDFKLFLEMFGTFNYVVPSNKEQQMYDFYMLELLKGRAKNKNFGPGNLENPDQQADYMLEEVAEKLLPYLKKEFLEVMATAIAGEVKNTFDRDALIEPLKSILDEREVNSLLNYINDKNYSRNEDPHTRDILTTVNKHFGNIDNFLHIVKNHFIHSDWEGGEPTDIYEDFIDEYYKLKNTKDNNSLIMAIDRVYHLQHLNGSIFSKVADYGNESYNFDWIKKALDQRRDAKSANDLLNKVSPSMRKLAGRMIQVKSIII